MIDLQNLPTQKFTEVFYAGGTTWQTWQKPSNASIVSIFVIGGGGGGGSGPTQLNGGVANIAGGGGGGSSAYAFGLFPAMYLPDTIYIQVGYGGAGAPSGLSTAAGSAGSLSYVSSTPGSTFISDLILASGNAAPGGGAASGAGGSAGSVFTLATSTISQMAMVSGAAGAAGGAGVSGNNGTSITPTLILSPGAGGGGKSSTATLFDGGSITAYGPAPAVAAGAKATSSTTIGSDGQNGVVWLLNPNNPLFFTGGSGGGASNANQGGRGGNGGYGCGGGGGGNGSSTTGGAGGGGKGGDGIVIITWR
jgi:hypothetical protein